MIIDIPMDHAHVHDQRCMDIVESISISIVFALLISTPARQHRSGTKVPSAQRAGVRRPALPTTTTYYDHYHTKREVSVALRLALGCSSRKARRPAPGPAGAGSESAPLPWLPLTLPPM